MPTVITSPVLASLEESFLQRVRSLKQADPLAPVTVVVGSNLQHIYLRRRLAEALGAVANVRFHTLLDLAGEIHLASDSGDDGLQALPEGGKALIVHSIIEEPSAAGGAVGFGAEAVGLPEAVAATLRDMREGMITAARLEDAEIPIEKRRALGEIYRAFQDKTQGFWDRTGIVEKAASASTAAVEAALPEAPVLVYGIYDLNELQFRTLGLIAASRDVTAFVPWEEGSPSLQFAGDLVQRLLSSGFELRDPPPAAGEPDSRVETFSAADRQSESEETVRRVLSDVEDGVPPGDIAVLHRLDQGHDEVVGGVLERAGLPFYAASGRPARRSAVGKAALNLLRLLCDEPRRGPLLEFLSLSCTRLDWVEDGLRRQPRRWEWISKDLGLVKGWGEFSSLLRFSLRNAAADPDDARANYQREGAETLLKVVDALAGEADSAASMSGWQALCGWFASLLERTIRAGPDGDAMDAIVDRVRRLSVLDAAGVPCDRGRFWQAAESAIRGATVSGGYFQRDGIFVGNVVSARGLRFRRVYLLECAERVFPPLIRQDPLLLDREREAVNRVAGAGSLPLKQRRLDEERLLFELARQSAREKLTVSYSRRTSLTGTPRLPSSLMLDLAAARAGRFQSIEEIERSDYDWFVRLPSRVGFEGALPEDAFRSLDASDLRLHALEKAGRSALSAVAPLWAGLDRLRLLRRERSEPRFGPFDGVVPAELVERAEVLARDLSATSLAHYAECPYRFFLGKVLGLSWRREPEETLEISAAERGSFVHRVLERFVERFLAEGDGDWPAYLERAGEAVGAVIEEEVARLPAGVTGLPVSWQIAREEIEEDVREYLDEEGRRAGEGWRPVATEKGFQDVPLDAGRQSLTVRGAIDRLDVRDGGAVRVVDYKTGRVWEKADGYRRGRSLQLPLYLNAACREMDAAVDGSRAEYHYVSRRGGFSRVGLRGDEMVGDGRFAEVLEGIADGVASGAFFYWPLDGRSNCRLCDFFDVCHSQVAAHATRKAPGSAALREPFDRIARDEGRR